MNFAARTPPLAAAQASVLNIGGITTLLASVLTAVVLTVAIRSAMRAHRSDYASVLSAVGIVAVGAMMWALATGNDLPKLGTDLVNLVFNNL
jgi:hypothetical protein